MKIAIPFLLFVLLIAAMPTFATQNMSIELKNQTINCATNYLKKHDNLSDQQNEMSIDLLSSSKDRAELPEDSKDSPIDTL